MAATWIEEPLGPEPGRRPPPVTRPEGPRHRRALAARHRHHPDRRPPAAPLVGGGQERVLPDAAGEVAADERRGRGTTVRMMPVARSKSPTMARALGPRDRGRPPAGLRAERLLDPRCGHGPSLVGRRLIG